MAEFNVTAGVINGKIDLKGFVPIYIYIYQGSKLISKESLKHKVPSVLWNNSTKRVDKKFPNSKLINSIIDRKILELQTKFLEETVIRGTVDVKAVMIREKVKDMDFYEFAEKQITEKNYAAETRRNYRVYIEKMRSFKKHLRLLDIDYKFLQEYEAHLRDALKNEPNTVWGNLKFINTLTNDAVKMKYLIGDPFKTYTRPKYKQTNRTFLTTSEIAKIADYIDLSEDDKVKHIGYFFLFMCYSGLRFSDATRINSIEHIFNNERIVIKMQKTGKITNIFINDKLRPLLNYISANKVGCTQTDFNRKLKIIGAGAGLKKKISSHVGRHTFGASLAALGVPEKAAQGLLAHGSAASTKIYYHLQNSALDEAMKRFDG